MKIKKNLFKTIYSTLILGFNYDKKIEKAYKLLDESNKLDVINKIFYEIENCKITFNKNKFLNFKQHFNQDQNYEVTLSQIIHSNFIVHGFFSAKLLTSLAFNKLLYYPLPNEWLIILKKNNINVSFLNNCLIYVQYCIFLKIF